MVNRMLIRVFFKVIGYVLMVSPFWLETQASTPPSFYLNYSQLTMRDGIVLRVAHYPSPQSRLRSSKSTSKSKSVLLFLQGMGSFIERHEVTLKFFADQGFDVWTFDWRGQGGSARMTHVPSLCHIDRFVNYVDDLKEVISAIHKYTNSTAPVTIIANSMGGHVALRLAHDSPHLVHSMVLLAPMLDIKTRHYPKVLAQTLARSIVKLTGGENFVFGDRSFDPKSCLSRYRPNLHADKKEYTHMCSLLEEAPHLATGGVSFGWLHAAFCSIKRVQQDHYLEKITVPTLIISAEEDHVVDNKAQKKACSKMKNCHQIVYEKARHNLFGETAEIQKKMMADLLNFVKN